MAAPDDMRREQAILDAWHGNAVAWTKAVREGAIASRRLVTDAAMVKAVLSQQPRSVIDLGCGEGWLMRELTGRGIDVIGVDAVPALIDRAAAAVGSRVVTLDYAAVAAGALDARADVVVCNFSLFGDASVARLLQAVPGLLHRDGRLIVQTLHPLAACGDSDYHDGWRAGSWQGCGDGFSEAPPWYFRTFSGWIEVLAGAGLRVTEVVEPLYPEQARPASLILVARAD